MAPEDDLAGRSLEPFLFFDKDSILIKVWVFKNYMDNKMINPWTQVKSYHGHFERSQTV